MAEAFAKVDIGTDIGFVPETGSLTPVQEDMNKKLIKLKLADYKTAILKEINLDLRENRRVKSKDSAFLDLNRSIFFNKLVLLGIDFVSKKSLDQANASWAEKWNLVWSPEVEIHIVESKLLG